ncbi:hypothetical protein BFP70_06105 [Thioclava sp. SK-1]|nr:hypothetical protein BFP70_06105 [Thioclava sp. SK-1]
MTIAAASLFGGAVISEDMAFAHDSITQSFVHMAIGVPGALYQPDQLSLKARIAVMLRHSGGDYLSHTGCTELSQRDYSALCPNNFTRKTGRNFDIDIYQAISEAGKGVAYLRGRDDSDTVILMGHSGGSELFSAYQNIAKNRPAACQSEALSITCDAQPMTCLPPADGVMWLDPN